MALLLAWSSLLINKVDLNIYPPQLFWTLQMEFRSGYSLIAANLSSTNFLGNSSLPFKLTS